MYISVGLLTQFSLEDVPKQKMGIFKNIHLSVAKVSVSQPFPLG